MKIRFCIDYRTVWGQNLCIVGSVPELGDWNEDSAIAMVNTSPSEWEIEIDIENGTTQVEYRYIVKNQNVLITKEVGEPHYLKVCSDFTFDVQDKWIDISVQHFLYTSPFKESFYLNPIQENLQYNENAILLNVICPYVKRDQILVLCGASEPFGSWNPEKVLALIPVRYACWQLPIDATLVESLIEYKFAIYDKKMLQVVHWEEGENRLLSPLFFHNSPQNINVYTHVYQHNAINWRAAGVSIPVFSLRSEESSGIGEFFDLKKMIDWAVVTEQKVIQVLPINDTTSTHTWADSYPYNAISSYALHPVYLGLKDYPLKDQDEYAKYQQQFRLLNDKPEVDYEQVGKSKNAYLRALFSDFGEEIVNQGNYKDFCSQNKDWLFSYACFSSLRDRFNTSEIKKWGMYAIYDKELLEETIDTDSDISQNVQFVYFVQYLLHKQLVDVKEYAHQRGVIIKGDIPIGISPNSVEAWIEPHLFNLDTQTGAPPDDFSVFGQNWGFPTYNWTEMAKDGYQWWIKRFRKMSDYFDAYRIDHILGFFRIWEIPQTSVQGLLGHFSPALPLSVDEIRQAGMRFDEYRMICPYIHEHFLCKLFGDYKTGVIEEYLKSIAFERYELKPQYDNQAKIAAHFADLTDDKNQMIHDGLFSLCNEVLFVRDKREPAKFHPRITAQYTNSYKDLDNQTRNAFDNIYNNFYYHRHAQFWQDEAMEKLPSLISSTSMLVCGEDLGMVPHCVPEVMKELQILSLEIERMPKAANVQFCNLSELPYLSVCTTSTHDMSPIRLWWEENEDVTQIYFNEVLCKEGVAPRECTPDLSRLILENHLNSPAMLVILPLQDWLAMDDGLRRQNPADERINIPSSPKHYWRYRMHISLEELLNANGLNVNIVSLVESSGRI